MLRISKPYNMSMNTFLRMSTHEFTHNRTEWLGHNRVNNNYTEPH
jgi:hypothetical protein